jgi:hypothetical protein
MPYYWSIASTDPPVYHWKARCPDGERIHPNNRRNGTTSPSGRRTCHECTKVA